ncbi:class I SAM-dependent methyltransferase [Desulfovibrio sp. XJ01]|nr:class I SAM-dependent methyltransferase [Nitratidesulfovibrio liaohensis]
MMEPLWLQSVLGVYYMEAVVLNKKIKWYSVDSFWGEVAAHIEHTDVVLDVGCGIVPMNYFRPALHIMLEPYKEYSDILLERHKDDKSILVLCGKAQETLKCFSDNSVDTVFLLDVIEHFEKHDGFDVLRHLERIARKQVIVFTPLGFMPQHAEAGETDGWGLSGVSYQDHLSGWLPEDFGETWDFHICEDFHSYDFRQRKLDQPYGAMFAIKTFTHKLQPKAENIINIRRPLPSEIELDRVTSVLNITQAELAATQAELATTQAAFADAQLVLNKPIIRVQRKLWRLVKFWK